MKRQDPNLHSSSSRRDTSPAPPNHNLRRCPKNVGCMSGLLRLVCKYQDRRRFLTFGKKLQEKNDATTVSSSPPTKPGETDHNSTRPENSIGGFQRFSCEVPRSPTLPPEIRRSNSLNSLEYSFRTQPSVVAKLMGLDDTPVALESSVAEKRRRLLGALEKCDEDLKALKKIIEMVKNNEVSRCSSDSTVVVGSETLETTTTTTKGELQPSPVSVLDEFMTRSPFSGYSKRYSNNNINGGAGVPQQQKKKPGEEDLMNASFIDRITTEIFKGKTELSTPLWSSKAMIESLNEVCKDIAWGERREIGRIGLALQDFIFRDLIEEIAEEMISCGSIIDNLYPRHLPFESCKRRLPF